MIPLHGLKLSMNNGLRKQYNLYGNIMKTSNYSASFGDIRVKSCPCCA